MKPSGARLDQKLRGSTEDGTERTWERSRVYRTVAQLDSVRGRPRRGFPNCGPATSCRTDPTQGRRSTLFSMRAGGGSNRRGVLLVGGMHARELMNPDAIVDLQLDLVTSYLNGRASCSAAGGGRRWISR